MNAPETNLTLAFISGGMAGALYALLTQLPRSGHTLIPRLCLGAAVGVECIMAAYTFALATR
jgi:hypothetical protein